MTVANTPLFYLVGPHDAKGKKSLSVNTLRLSQNNWSLLRGDDIYSVFDLYKGLLEHAESFHMRALSHKIMILNEGYYFVRTDEKFRANATMIGYARVTDDRSPVFRISYLEYELPDEDKINEPATCSSLEVLIETIRLVVSKYDLS